METNNRYSGFDYAAHELVSFKVEGNTVLISKKDGEVISHEPEDINGFCVWLLQNNVRDVLSESIYNGFLL